MSFFSRKKPPVNRLRKAPAAPKPPVRARMRDLGRRMMPYALACAAAGGLTAGVVFGWRYVTRSSKFAIADIRFQGVTHAPVDELERHLPLSKGDNIFRADLRAAARDLLQHPWVADAKLHRELPQTVVVEVTERQPAAAVHLEALYLVDRAGKVFKRATMDEADGLLVVTGIDRDQYVDDTPSTEALIREALDTAAAWGNRAALSEANVHPTLGVTLYLRDGGTEVRLGRGDLPRKLARYDYLSRELARRGEKPRAFVLDSVTRPDRVAVRLSTQAQGG